MASPVLAGLVILMIGDSHFAFQGGLSTTLQSLLVEQGAKVTTYAACGATASVWANSGSATCGASERVQLGAFQVDHSPAARVPSITTLAASVRPGLIIVGLGDTMANYASAAFPTQFVTEDVSRLTQRIQATYIPCVWIGPGSGTEGGPYFKTYARSREMSNFLATHVAPCKYIDSTTFSQQGEWGTSDGLHYNGNGYQKWAFAIDAAILKLAPHAE